MAVSVARPSPATVGGPPASGWAARTAGRRGRWARFSRRRAPLIGAAVLILLVLACALGPLLVPHERAIRPNPLAFLQPPSAENVLGTDEVGRDVLARLIYGGRLSLIVGALAMALAVALGTTLGIVGGFYGGIVDAAAMRASEVLLSLPQLFVLIVLASVFGPSPTTLVLVIGAMSWMEVARVVRSSVLSLRNRDFVESAKAVGATGARILARHVLPNTAGLVIVASALAMGRAMLTEAAVSYIGMGIQPPEPSWGNMLLNAQNYFTQAPWVAILPGLLILATVLSVSTVGSGLRDALDPRG